MRVNAESYQEQLRRFYLVKKLVHEGRSYSEIGTLLGVTRQRVGAIAKRPKPPYPRGFGRLLEKHRKKCRVSKCKAVAAARGICPEHYAKAHGLAIRGLT